MTYAGSCSTCFFQMTPSALTSVHRRRCRLQASCARCSPSTRRSRCVVLKSQCGISWGVIAQGLQFLTSDDIAAGLAAAANAFAARTPSIAAADNVCPCSASCRCVNHSHYPRFNSVCSFATRSLRRSACRHTMSTSCRLFLLLTRLVYVRRIFSFAFCRLHHIFSFSSHPFTYAILSYRLHAALVVRARRPRAPPAVRPNHPSGDGASPPHASYFPSYIPA